MTNLCKLAPLAVALAFASMTAAADPHKNESGHHRRHAHDHHAHFHAYSHHAHSGARRCAEHARWRHERKRRVRVRQGRAHGGYYARPYHHWRERPARRYLRRAPDRAYIYVDLRL